MKNLYFAVILLISCTAKSQIINFVDPNFKAKLLASQYNNWPNYYLIAADINQVDMVVDTNGDGEIDVAEAQAVYYLKVQGSTPGDAPTDLFDLSGIEYFTNLIELNCADNVLTTLDVSALTNLNYLRCDRNNITFLNTSGLVNLNYFSFGGNELPNLDISHLVNLTELYCDNTGSTNMDFSAQTELTRLFCGNNPLQSLDLSH